MTLQYKVWVQVEELDQDEETEQNVGEPICLYDADEFIDAERFLLRLGALFQSSDMATHEWRRLHELEEPETVEA